MASITALATASSSRHILPSDLPTATKHLNDQELDQLQAAVTAEQQRRSRKPPAPEKAVSKRTEAPAVTLSIGKLNAVRAGVQGWRQARKDCQAVRNISIGCSEGAGIRQTKTLMSSRIWIRSRGG